MTLYQISIRILDVEINQLGKADFRQRIVLTMKRELEELNAEIADYNKTSASQRLDFKEWSRINKTEMIYKQTHTYEIIVEILPEWCHAYEDLESDNPAQTLRDYYGKDVDGNEMLKSNLALKFVVYNFKTMRSATYSSLNDLEPEFTN